MTNGSSCSCASTHLGRRMTGSLARPPYCSSYRSPPDQQPPSSPGSKPRSPPGTRPASPCPPRPPASLTSPPALPPVQPSAPNARGPRRDRRRSGPLTPLHRRLGRRDRRRPHGLRRHVPPRRLPVPRLRRRRFAGTLPQCRWPRAPTAPYEMSASTATARSLPPSRATLPLTRSAAHHYRPCSSTTASTARPPAPCSHPCPPPARPPLTSALPPSRAAGNDGEVHLSIVCVSLQPLHRRTQRRPTARPLPRGRRCPALFV